MRPPISRALLEQRARLDYKAVEGRVIRYTGDIECFRNGEDCGPVAVKDALLRVVPGNMYDIRRWMDDVSLDPTWTVEFVAPIPAEFANDTSWYVYAPSYSLDKDAPVDYVDYEVVEDVPTGTREYVVVGYYETGERYCGKYAAGSNSAAEDHALRDNIELIVVESIAVPLGFSPHGNDERQCVVTHKDLDCEHAFDWKTVSPVSMKPGFFDVSCSKCGASGTFRLSPEEICW